jgi:hypothetical protein
MPATRLSNERYQAISCVLYEAALEGAPDYRVLKPGAAPVWERAD